MEDTKQKILVIDDEIKLLEAVKEYLKMEGFDVFTSYNGEEALKLFRIISPDFVVLDLMLPDISGEDICKKIRETSDVPILMLTAKIEENDRINGLLLGADDYMTKPFSIRELTLRIKTILRRTTKKSEADYTILKSGNIEIDTVKHLVKKAGFEVNLTPNEYKILLTLAENPGRAFSREQLLNSALGYDFIGFDRTVDAHIKNIRQKIEDDVKNPKYIITIFGIGYKFQGELL